MKKTVVMIMFFTIIVKIFGLLRDIALSYFYGATEVSDAYIISLTIPKVIFVFIGMAIAAGFIPVYSKVIESESKESAMRFTSNILNILFVIAGILVTLTFVFSNELVVLFASGFDEETQQLASDFTRITVFAIFATSFTAVFKSYFQVNSKFITPILILLPMNLIIIFTIVLSYYYGNKLLPYGYLVAMLSQIFVMIPYLKKMKFKYSAFIDLKNSNIRKLGYISVPIIISVAVSDINKIIDKTLASKISVGGISSLNYAISLNGFVQGVAILAITTTMYPLISRMAATNNINKLKQYVLESINLSLLLIIPATFGAMFFSTEIINLLYSRGSFNENAAVLTSSALFYYSIGMISIGLRELVSRTFYSLNDTKTPMIFGFVTVALNVTLNLLFFYNTNLGIGGLALATSISSTLTTIALLVILNSKVGKFNFSNTILTVFKIFCASIIMIVISKLFYTYAGVISSNNIRLIISIIIGVLVYFLATLILKVKEVRSFYDLFLKKILYNNEN